MILDLYDPFILLLKGIVFKNNCTMNTNKAITGQLKFYLILSIFVFFLPFQLFGIYFPIGI